MFICLFVLGIGLYWAETALPNERAAMPRIRAFLRREFAFQQAGWSPAFRRLSLESRLKAVTPTQVQRAKRLAITQTGITVLTNPVFHESGRFSSGGCARMKNGKRRVTCHEVTWGKFVTCHEVRVYQWQVTNLPHNQAGFFW